MDIPTLNLSANPADKNIRYMWVVVFLVLFISAGAGWFAYQSYISSKSVVPIKVNSDYDYQAVFLTGGQVYFGKLEIGEDWMVLKEAYYLQTAGGGGTQDINVIQANFQLIKLGSEIHGPTDEMYINRENVLFWENMKNDSRVVEAIKRYQTR